MPSRAYTSFLPVINMINQQLLPCVNALSGLYLISTTVQMRDDICYTVDCVNALSGLYLISTNVYDYIAVTHYIEGVNALSGLYLISTKKELDNMSTIDECQCPLGLIPHFYGTPSKT